MVQEQDQSAQARAVAVHIVYTQIERPCRWKKKCGRVFDLPRFVSRETQRATSLRWD